MNARDARELRHYQRRMVIYRRRLAWTAYLLRDVQQAHARDAMAVVGWYSKCKQLEARVAELESEK